MKYIFNIVAVFASFTSCSNKDFVLPENANQLLTNNSSKTWKLAKRYNDNHRMTMGDCFRFYRVTYFSDGKTMDNNSDNEDCGESMNANWNFHADENGSFIKLKGEKVKILLHQEKDFKYFKIFELTDSLLVIKFRHKQVGNTSRLITDYLVPEHHEVNEMMFVNKTY